MVARQQIGDIFLGVTPAGIRQYMRQAFTAARAQYTRVVLPCAGRFTVAEAAIDAGWKAVQIETSDVSLFSSVLGYACAGKPLAELGIAFHGELEFLNKCSASHLAGAVLYGMKVCQLSPKKYFEATIRKELLREPHVHIEAMQAQVEELKKRLGGIQYAIEDVRAHCARASADPSAIIYVNPPGFAKGYAKMFDTKGAITWADPKIPEFDAKADRAALYDLLMPAPALVYVFRSKQPEPGVADKAVFALARNANRDFVLCNRPEQARVMVASRKPTPVAPAKIPFLPEGHTMTAESRIWFAKIEKAKALYYRDLFAHKLAATRAEQYFVALCDGHLMAVFGMFFSEVMRNQSGTVYEVFGFTAPNKRYPRINHLFMASLVSEDARKFFTAECKGVRDVDRFQTTCISTTPEQKSHRSTGLKLISKEQREDGRFKLVYAGGFRPFTMRQTIERWLAAMTNVEIQTGKPMGVTKIPAAAVAGATQEAA